MSKIFLNLSIMVESDDELDAVQEAVKYDLDKALEIWSGGVLALSWDREMALQSNLQALDQHKQSIDLQREQALEESEQVANVLARLNLVLPKTKYGHAEWRVPNGVCYGESRGLQNLRGELVLTNGVTGILVLGYANERAKWVQIHFDNFIPDRVETLPTGLTPKTKEPKERVDHKLMAALEGF